MMDAALRAMRVKREASAIEVPRPLGTVQAPSILRVAQEALQVKRMKTERDAPSSMTPATPASSGVAAVSKAEFASPCVGGTSVGAMQESKPSPVVRYVALTSHYPLSPPAYRPSDIRR